MARSQNGYSANDRSRIATYTVPGTDLRIALRRGACALVLLNWCAWWNREIEPLKHTPQDLWGYAERTIRGSSTELSNHASGTAADLRATAHPRGVPISKTFTRGEVAKIHARLRLYDGVLRWGGDYKNSPPDGMHIEIDRGIKAVRRVARDIREGGLIDKVPRSKDKDGPRVRRTLSEGSRGNKVALVQRLLGLNDDGIFGPKTERKVKAYQRMRGLKVDGIVGPQTWSHLELMLRG